MSSVTLASKVDDMLYDDAIHSRIYYDLVESIVKITGAPDPYECGIIRWGTPPPDEPAELVDICWGDIVSKLIPISIHDEYKHLVNSHPEIEDRLAWLASTIHFLMREIHNKGCMFCRSRAYWLFSKWDDTVQKFWQLVERDSNAG